MLATCDLRFKISKNSKGYVLLERTVDEKTYKVCLFENHWLSLQPLIGCINYDLHEQTSSVYKWYAYKPNSYVQDACQIVKVQEVKGCWYVILGFVDRKTDRSYTWWLTADDWERLASQAHDIKKHFAPVQMLIDRIYELARENCQGCKIQHGTQNQHLGGCISHLPEIAPIYMESALKDCNIDLPLQDALELIKDF